MESRRINTELSRTTNGNFASSFSAWYTDGFKPPDLFWTISNTISADETTPWVEMVVRYPNTSTLYNDITYRDLSIFPSAVRFGVSPAGILLPVDYRRYLLSASPVFPPTLVYPFGTYVNTETGLTEERAKAGTPVIVDSAEQYGEYRIQKTLAMNMALVVPGGAPSQPDLSGDSAAYSYKSGDPNFVVDLGVSGAPMGNGEIFACADPPCAGLIIGASGTQIWVLPTTAPQAYPPATYFGSTPVQKAMKDWKIERSRAVSFVRALETALYDLLLAFTYHTGSGLMPEASAIQILDETDRIILTIPPAQIDGTNVFIDKSLPGPFVRRFQRFVYERKYPYYGRARLRLRFTAESRISNVNLYRGDYLEKMLSGSTEKIDVINTHTDVNTGIVPVGTIIAYTGGPCCPPGYEKVRGIGQWVGRIGQGAALVSELALPSVAITDVELDRRTSRGDVNDPRTILKLDRQYINRAIPAESFTYQKSRRLVNITPFRYDPTHHMAPTLISARNQIGDPHPVWVTDTYEKTDIQPGCILELQDGGSGLRIFMIVSQYAEGTFISHYVESGDEGPGTFYPQGRDADDWRRANRQVANGMDRNSVYLGYRIYGYRFVPQYEDRALVEVVGDWVDVINGIRAHANSKMRVWKSGVLAHAQAHPEPGLENDDAYGGYGLWADPHSHYLGQSDASILSNLEVGDPDWETFVPIKHRHGWLFGAATIPRVRPVLLCQKI